MAGFCCDFRVSSRCDCFWSRILSFVFRTHLKFIPFLDSQNRILLVIFIIQWMIKRKREKTAHCTRNVYKKCVLSPVIALNDITKWGQSQCFSRALIGHDLTTDTRYLIYRVLYLQSVAIVHEFLCSNVTQLHRTVCVVAYTFRFFNFSFSVSFWFINLASDGFQRCKPAPQHMADWKIVPNVTGETIDEVNVKVSETKVKVFQLYKSFATVEWQIKCVSQTPCKRVLRYCEFTLITFLFRIINNNMGQQVK